MRSDAPHNIPFSTTNQYVAVTPAGFEGLNLVRQFVTDLQHGPTAATASATTLNVHPLVGLLAFFLGTDTNRLISAAFVSDAVASTSQWSIFSRDQQIRERVLPQLQTTRATDPAQVRLAIMDPNRAAVGDYLHAYAYLASREASGLVVQMLNDLTGHFALTPQQGLPTAQRIFEATPVCPLKGTLKWTEAKPCGFWTSSAWQESSPVDVKKVPSDYRFPFLNWLRGANVECALTGTTLSADVRLEVMQRSAGSPAQGPLRKVDAEDSAKVSAGTLATAEASSPIAPGDQVVVTTDRASLRIGTRTEMELPRDTTLSVIDVRGNWIGVWGLRQGKAVRGWIHRRELARQ